MNRSHFLRRRTWVLLPLAITLLLAATDLMASEAFQEIQKRIHSKTLPNGLKVIIVENHDAPVVSFVTQVNAGASDEVMGITGVAHLLEHMAFKGTKTIGTKDYNSEKEAMEAEDRIFETILKERAKGNQADTKMLQEMEEALKEAQEKSRAFVLSNEFDEILSREGAQGLNAGTGFDTTTYFFSLPSNRLELGALIESDRFVNPVLREFHAEKQVVAEERRVTVESSPQGRLFDEFLSAAFKAHSYGKDIGGHMSDIQNMTRKATRDFFEKYYNASNMVVCVAGDVYPEEAWPLIDKYFGRIPKGRRPNPVMTKEPVQFAERRVTCYEEAQPILILGFHKPSYTHPDRLAYDALSDVLGSGRSSRLYKNLVKDKKIAMMAASASGMPGQKYPNLFICFGVPAKGHNNQEVEKAIWEEIDLVKADPVMEKELAKFKTKSKANFIRGLDSNLGMARQLAFYETMTGDWRNMFKELEKIEKVSVKDVRRVAKEIFARENLVVASIETKEDDGE